MSPAREEAAPWARRWAPVFAWAAVILVLTSWPGQPHGEDVGVVDKIAHFGVYGVLGWLSARAMLPPRRAGRLFAVGLALALFATLDELHQFLIPFRFVSVADWTADLLGLSIGLLAYHLTRALLAQPNDSPS